MRIERYDARSLHPMEGNPRTITTADVERLRSSIQSYGLFKPLLVWTDDEGRRCVVGGNQRLRVLTTMIEAGELPMAVTLRNGTTVEVTTEVPCVEFPGTYAEAKAVALRDNNADGEWDWDVLPNYMAELAGDLGADADLSALTGFDAAMLDDLSSLVNAYDVDVDFTGEPLPSQPEVTERKLMKFGFGKMTGMVPLDVYDRFLRVFSEWSDQLDSKEIKVVLVSMLDALEETDA